MVDATVVHLPLGTFLTRVEMPYPPGEGLTVHIHQAPEQKPASVVDDSGGLSNTLTLRIGLREEH